MAKKRAKAKSNNKLLTDPFAKSVLKSRAKKGSKSRFVKKVKKKLKL